MYFSVQIHSNLHVNLKKTSSWGGNAMLCQLKFAKSKLTETSIWPSIKDVSSNFSFLTPPTYPCLLFSLNNLIIKSPFDPPTYLSTPLRRRPLWMVPNHKKWILRTYVIGLFNSWANIMTSVQSWSYCVLTRF